MTDANCMRLSVTHAAHPWTIGRPGGRVDTYQCDGTPAGAVRAASSAGHLIPSEPSHAQQLQAQAVHTVFQALGGLQVYGFDGSPSITMDDITSVRSTQRHIDQDGTRWLYTTRVTVSVTRGRLGEAQRGAGD